MSERKKRRFGRNGCRAIGLLAALVIFVLFAVGVSKAVADDAPGSVDILIGAERSIARVNGEVVFRAVFKVDDPGQFACLAIEKPLYIKNLSINGAPVAVPIEGMSYNTIPGIPVMMLRKGSNTLTARWRQKARKIDHADLDIRLLGMMPSALRFQTGAILGYAGENFFTVSCRVNIPAEVVLDVGSRKYTSKSGLLHSFKVKSLKPDTQYEYSLKARVSERDGCFSAALGPYPVRTLPAAGAGIKKFAVLGDSRTHPEDWTKVAAAVAAQKPALAVFVGDMVADGRIDNQWDEQYFAPAVEFFATIPHYAVIGNHEQNCPLFTRIFQTSGGKNWSQEVGSVLLIGIDGKMDYSIGSDLYRWLEGILAGSQAKFIFLASHYPPWSSGHHGRLEDGRPREKSARVSREVIVPLLKKYNATAMFAGHEHFYERSESSGGVTVVITGGAGAPLHNKAKNAAVQNPHSKVFAKKHHYCLLTVDGDVCTMKVLTPEGEIIDTRTWTASRKK